MRKVFMASALFVGIVMLGGPMACAQEQKHSTSRFQLSSADLAMTFTTERSNGTPGGGGDFWLYGGSIDAAATFFHAFGLAANVTEDHASGIAPGVNLSKLAFMGGPRYTFRLGSKSKSRGFVEVLAGEAHGFNSIFPASTGESSKANSFAWQVGGGLDLSISKHLAIRAIEADYVRTNLPNNGANHQDHVRLAFGVCYHIQSH